MPVRDAPFDAAAADYDQHFTERRLARWLRQMVWAQLEALIAPGQRILELNGGTGEDATWLAQRGCRVLLTDGAAEMQRLAAQKIAARDLVDRVEVAPLDLNDLNAATAAPFGGPFDGVLSNFGGVNCVADRPALAQWLAERTGRGAWLALVPMGPYCPWEIGWHLLHGQPRQAFRRRRKGALAHAGAGQYLPIWYPSPRQLRRDFAPYFAHPRTLGIGTLLPPSYLDHWVERWPSFFERMRRIDAHGGGRWPFRSLNDHYLMILERR